MEKIDFYVAKRVAENFGHTYLEEDGGFKAWSDRDEEHYTSYVDITCQDELSRFLNIDLNTLAEEVYAAAVDLQNELSTNKIEDESEKVMFATKESLSVGHLILYPNELGDRYQSYKDLPNVIIKNEGTDEECIAFITVDEDAAKALHDTEDDLKDMRLLASKHEYLSEQASMCYAQGDDSGAQEIERELNIISDSMAKAIGGIPCDLYELEIKSTLTEDDGLNENPLLGIEV